MSIAIRLETPGDEAKIHSVTKAAFAGRPHSGGNEQDIVDNLRTNGDLVMSLVALVGGNIVGHIAFSAVSIGDRASHWFGLGPVSVAPEVQRQGIGSALIERGIAELRGRRARGIVLLGNPHYYARFGFEHDPELHYPGPPAKYFQRLVLWGEPPSGIVTYAAAFV